MAIKKILLIQPPLGRGMSKELFQPIFPYGLAHVATALQNNNYEVEILDIYANRWNRNQVLEKIKDIRCDIIGITAMSTQYDYVKWLSGELKKILNVKIILGGLLATYSSSIVLNHTDIDICVIGEGEITAVELLHNINTIERVDGIAFKKSGEIIFTPQRNYIENLDDLPLPAYDLFPMEVYTKTRFYIHDPTTKIFKQRLTLKTIGVLTGRGCPYHCTFCSKSFTGLRLKSVDAIIREIQFLKEKYNIEGVHFIDELFIVNRTRARELSAGLASLNLKWDAQGRVNTVDYDLLCEMKKAGCVAIGLGIESGSDTILQKMHKHITSEQSAKAIEAARQAGLHVKIQLILGYPGESRETIEETVKFFNSIKHPARRFSLILPLPGSELYNYALDNKLIADEEYYLTQIYDGYGGDRYPVFINFTDLPTEELYRLKKSAEKEMENNYRRYLMNHPSLYVKYLYGCMMNAVYTFIRRLVKFINDPVFYFHKICARVFRF